LETVPFSIHDSGALAASWGNAGNRYIRADLHTREAVPAAISRLNPKRVTVDLAEHADARAGGRRAGGATRIMAADRVRLIAEARADARAQPEDEAQKGLLGAG
jgi:hypothetical protein